MRNVAVIIRKQLKDTLKNKTVLIQFIMFPVMTLIMETPSACLTCRSSSSRSSSP